MNVRNQDNSNRYTEQERELGGLEYIFRESIAVTAFTLKGTVNHTVLEQALNSVVQANPLLACRLKQQKGKYCFRHTPHTKTTLITANARPNFSLNSLVEREMSTKFNCGEPLFRCQLILNTDIENCVLLASFSHAIYDGLSLSYFINSLLVAYQHIDNEEQLILKKGSRL